jgi:hypothetical protein
MLLDIDSTSFEQSFDRRPLRISHSLAEHPLLSLESLAALAESLPADLVEHNLGDLPKVVDPNEVRQADLSVGEIARSIDTNGCWMVLKKIEHDERYARLLDEALDEVGVLVAHREGGMTDRQGFVFLSSPGSITPSHTDPEHNFLLQVRGTKDMNVGRFSDQQTEQLALEQALGGGHRNIKWEPREPECFNLEPGDGVYVQPHAPHWVENGPAASVSLSITFQTPVNKRAIRIHSLNAKLRRLGVSPSAPGRRPGVDRGKDACGKVLGRLGRH